MGVIGNGNVARTADGQFLVGNPGGPGDPLVARQGGLRRALAEAVSDADIKSIAQKLVTLAEAGDVRAADAIMNRLMGKPEQRITVTHEQRSEGEILERLGALLAAHPDIAAAIASRARAHGVELIEQAHDQAHE